MDLDNIGDSELLLGDATEEFAPPSVMVSAPAMDIGFHPQLPIFAVGLVTGEVEIYEYSGCDIAKKPLVNDFSSWVFGRQRMYSGDDVVVTHHGGNMRMHPTGSVSAMEFTDDGSYLVTASGDRTISVLDCISARLVIHLTADQVMQKTGSKKRINKMNAKTHAGATKLEEPDDENARRGTGGGRVHMAITLKKSSAVVKAKKKTYAVTPNPHKFGISALNVCDDNFIATGDDDGLVAIWDMRERKPVHTYHEHGDYVSQLCYFTDVQELVSSSGDTCLGCYDVRAGRIRDFSEPRKDEINCFAFINSTATNNRSFIPSIMCGTPTGNLPVWKYGSWRRPYDVMEYHPRECETIVSFHGEDTTFNHNIVLTGACDGLVRVIQMYPVRRNICQISARDYTYAYQNGPNRAGSSSGNAGNFVVRRGRGHEGISKMRVSHDSNLLAVSGSDNIIDFVDIRFLNHADQLDQLRGRAERRHMSTLRRMEAEAVEEAAEMLDKDFGSAEAETYTAPAPVAGEGDAAITKAEPPTGVAAPCKVGGERKKVDHSSSSSEDGEGSDDGAESSDSEPTEEDKRKSMAMKDRLIALLRERTIAKKRERAEREAEEAFRKANATSSDDDNDFAEKRNKKGNENGGGEGVESGSDFDSSDDDDMFSSDDEGLIARKKRRLRAQRAQVAAAKRSVDGESGNTAVTTKRKKKELEAKTDAAQVDVPVASGTETAAMSYEDQSKAAMDAYQATRQEKRARVAAAKWLKEEKKKKINFTYEKRRRRVGGFFSDMVNHD